MRRQFLRAKLHRLTVTHSELEYEGSIAIDGYLLDAADIREYERVEVYNIANGARFNTYAVRAGEHSGVVSIMGAAAHRADPGDLVIVAAYAELEEKELAGFKPRLIYVDGRNRMKAGRNFVPVQVA
ncbi:MAG: aspartate 1-decarboxylase [Gammaproteobacteria bacterium]|jgi:aspartate 1-decarboxylase|nr:aspartate 1-decarboxylase [Gammaproteobacteria bacterium]